MVGSVEGGVDGSVDGAGEGSAPERRRLCYGAGDGAVLSSNGFSFFGGTDGSVDSGDLAGSEGVPDGFSAGLSDLLGSDWFVSDDSPGAGSKGWATAIDTARIQTIATPNRIDTATQRRRLFFMDRTRTDTDGPPPRVRRQLSV